MFTKNWYAIASSEITGASAPYTNLSGDSMTTISDGCNAIKFGTTNGYSPVLTAVQKVLNGSGGVILGTGTTPPTVDDYCLSGEMLTTFEATITVQPSADDTGCEITGTYNIVNTSDKAFTIGEVGLIAPPIAHSYTQYKALVERTVLDTPVTIPAGGIGQVTYTIRFNYPTA